MAMQMQSLLARPVGDVVNGSRTTRMAYPSGLMCRLENRVGLRVKCMAEQGPEGEPNIASSSPIPTPTPPQPKAKTSFTDVFAFSGLAPERINGRLAMIGFTAALGVEISRGTDLFAQITDGGAQWFLGTSILLTVASLVPLFKGVIAESKTEGLMNSKAELWNGRLAMLGLVALAFTEYIIGGALV